MKQAISMNANKFPAVRLFRIVVPTGRWAVTAALVTASFMTLPALASAQQSDGQRIARVERDFGGDQWESRQSDAKYRLVLRITDQAMASIGETGMASSNVPEPQVGGVVAIKVLSLNPMVPDFKTVEAETVVEDDELRISLTEEMIRMMEFQALNIPVEPGDYTKVILQAPLNLDIDTDAGPVEGANAWFHLLDGRSFAARLDEGSSVKMDAAVGPVDIPVEQIQAAGMNYNSEGGMILLLKDGSRISGNGTGDTIRMTTNWGTHEIELSSLYTMTTSPDIRLDVLTSNGDVHYRLVQIQSDQSLDR